MSILYNKTWVISTRSIDANQVKTWATGATIACKIEPVQDLAWTGLDGIAWFDVKQIFTDNMDVKISDKITIDSVDYNIKWVKHWDWLMRKYSICYAVAKEWN